MKQDIKTMKINNKIKPKLKKYYKNKIKSIMNFKMNRIKTQSIAVIVTLKNKINLKIYELESYQLKKY